MSPADSVCQLSAPILEGAGAAAEGSTAVRELWLLMAGTAHAPTAMPITTSAAAAFCHPGIRLQNPSGSASEFLANDGTARDSAGANFSIGAFSGRFAVFFSSRWIGAGSGFCSDLLTSTASGALTGAIAALRSFVSVAGRPLFPPRCFLRSSLSAGGFCGRFSIGFSTAFSATAGAGATTVASSITTGSSTASTSGAGANA